MGMVLNMFHQITTTYILIVIQVIIPPMLWVLRKMD